MIQQLKGHRLAQYLVPALLWGTRCWALTPSTNISPALLFSAHKLSTLERTLIGLEWRTCWRWQRLVEWEFCVLELSLSFIMTLKICLFHVLSAYGSGSPFHGERIHPLQNPSILKFPLSEKVLWSCELVNAGSSALLLELYIFT